MPEYIAREAIIEQLEAARENTSALGIGGACFSGGIDRAIEIINSAPAIDPVYAAGACYCAECSHADKCTQIVEHHRRDSERRSTRIEDLPLMWCSYGAKIAAGEES